ncbi:MAG: amidohydrolase family protein [Deltaproteobacteria bacterium]|nr:amidohydrolase family protein [Deltaproteobacteria bacterium]
MEDLVIKNGILVTPQGRIRGGLTISGGKITAVGSDGSLPKARQEVDAQGFMILPGLIDPHVHLGQDKEEKFRDQCRSESISAALGGITTMITTARFGNALEPRLPTYRKAKEIGRNSSFIDFKFNAFMTNQKHLQEIEGLMEEGVCSYKLMMAYTREEAKQIGLEGIDWGFAYRLFEIVAKLGPPALAQIHCEEPEIIHTLRQRLIASGRQDIAAWTESRPSICEAMQLYDAGLLAQELGTPLYIVHISAKESVDALQYFRCQGVQIYGETCTHYLVMDRNPACGILAKVNPPLRDVPDQNRIWKGLAEGTLDTIGSDHVPYMRVDKETGGIWKAMPGFGAMGATLSLLVSEGVHKGRLTWEQLVKLTSENAAKIYRIYPQKGALSPGSDADLVIVVPSREWVLSAENLMSRSDFTIYEGKKVKGRAVKTFVRGRLIAENGHLAADKPSGEYVAPSW